MSDRVGNALKGFFFRKINRGVVEGNWVVVVLVGEGEVDGEVFGGFEIWSFFDRRVGFENGIVSAIDGNVNAVNT